MVKTFEDVNINLMGASGEEIRTLCPECTPQRKKQSIKDLSVNTITKTWFCHHCGWKGGLSGNVKVYVKPEYKESLLPEKVIKWFLDRGISESTLRTNKIGYGPVWMPAKDKEVNAVQFPFYKNGVVVNIKYRDGEKNFRQAKNAEKCFYGFDRMRNESDTLIITEGEIDALTLIECGFYETVSMPDGAPPANAKNYTTKFDFLKSAEEKIIKYKKVILCVDNDEPGKLAERELARRIGLERCWCVKYPEKCKDINDTLKHGGSSAVKHVISEAKPYPIDGLFIFEDSLDELEYIYDHGFEKGLSTGWVSLDEYYTIKLGELTIITGIPNSGKSNWLDCLMLNLIDLHDLKFAIFSPENWPIVKHKKTLIEKITGRPFFKTFNKNFPRMEKEEIKDTANFLNDKITFIQPLDEDNPNITKIIELARQAVFRSGINALVIDPWNEIDHGNFEGLTETQYISKAIGKLRKFGALNGVHIFIVAHPQKLKKNDSGGYDAPTMYDISGGAHWRNKADNGICVHRIFKENEKDHVEIYIQKIRNRDLGKLGKTKLRYEYATAKYIDDVEV